VVDPHQPWPEVDRRFSNLDDALQLAGEMLQGNPGRILMASDGLSDDSALVNATVQKLAAGGNRIDVLALTARVDPNDLYVGELAAPSILWEDTPLQIGVPIHNLPATGIPVEAVQVTINGQTLEDAAEFISAEILLISLPPQTPGILELAVKVDLPDDPFPANNAAYSTLMVYPSPKILLVTTQPIDSFSALLGQNGLEANVRSPEELSSDLAGLADYQVIIINNVLASRFTTDQQTAIRAFAEEKGGGVIFLGGKNSYTLGGYKNTILEPILPVELEPPKRDESPPVVFALVLDKSDSMDVKQADNSRPINLAKEAAIRAVEMLDEQDQFGMLAFSNSAIWKVPIQPLGDGIVLRTAMDSISSIRAEGGTKMYQALQEALQGFETLPADQFPQRYVLLLTDGQSADGKPEEFVALARQAEQAGIVISTIALGEKADYELLRSIAEQGGGRYYVALNAQDLPRIMMSETRAARSENIQNGETSLQPGDPGHPVLSGLNGDRLPLFQAYNALTSKVELGAEDILVSSSFSDPILSAWQYGLGRVEAWMGDLGQDWVNPWNSTEDEAIFWSQVIRYALPNPAIGQAQVSINSSTHQTTVTALIQNAALQPINMLDVSFTYLLPGNTARSIPLSQTGPGIYQLELPRLPEGTYRALIEYAPPGQIRQEAAVPFAVNPPAEWIPVDAAEQEQGKANLLAWAAQSGGTEITSLEVGQESTAPSGTGRFAPSARWMIVLGLVAAWPLEIAVRRRWLPWDSRNRMK
jgi:uncharacterized membrane protein